MNKKNTYTFVIQKTRHHCSSLKQWGLFLIASFLLTLGDTCVADLRLTVDNPLIITGGNQVSYTIQYENSGGKILPHVNIDTSLLSGISYISGSIKPVSSGFDNSGNQQLSRYLGTLQPEQSGTILITGYVYGSRVSGTLLPLTATGYSQTSEGLKFDGINDYIQTPSTYDANNDFSISAIFRQRTLGNQRFLTSFSNSNISNGGFVFTPPYNSSFGIYFGLYSPIIGVDNCSIYTNNYTFNLNEVYHVVLVKETNNRNNWNIYINGVQVNTLKYGSNDIATGTMIGNPFRIGDQDTFPAYYNGDIYDMKFFNKALTTGEIKTLYLSSGTIIPATASGNIILDYRFQDRSGYNLRDYSTNNFTGTLNNFSNLTLGPLNSRITNRGLPYSGNINQSEYLTSSSGSSTYHTQSDISITLSGINTSYRGGDQIFLDILYLNSGHDSTTGTIILSRSTGLSLSASSLTGGLSGQSIIYTGILMSGYSSGIISLTLSSLLSGATSRESLSGIIQGETFDNNSTNNTSLNYTQIKKTNIGISQSITGIRLIGNTISYTLSYYNDSPEELVDITIINALPVQTSGISSSLMPSSIIDNLRHRSGLTLSGYQTGSIVLTAVIVSGNIGDNLINISTISSLGYGDTSSSNNITSHQEVLGYGPYDLSIQLSGNISTISGGKILPYTIQLQNNGPYRATGISIEHVIPISYSYTTHTIQDFSGIFNPQIISGETILYRDSISLSPGQQGYIIITGAAKSWNSESSGYQLTLSAQITGRQDISSSNNISTISWDYIQHSDLGMSITQSGTFTQEQPITYVIQYYNSGRDNNTGIHINFYRQTGLQFVSSSLNGQLGNNTYNRTGISLQRNQTGTITISLQPLSGMIGSQLIMLSGYITGSRQDTIQSNNYRSNSLLIDNTPDLWTSQSSSTGSLYSGDTIVYTITYGNSGATSASGVLLSSNISPYVSIISTSPSFSRSGGNTFERDIDSITPGQNGTIIMTGKVISNQGLSIQNNVSIRQDGGLRLNGISQIITAEHPLLEISNINNISFNIIFQGFGSILQGGYSNELPVHLFTMYPSFLQTYNVFRSPQNIHYFFSTNIKSTLSIIRESNIEYIYLNGSLLGTGGMGGFDTRGGFIRLGFNPYRSYFSGILYDLKIFNKSLTSGEIQQLYISQGSSIPSSASGNVVTDWRFNDMSGQVLSDRGPNNLSGSLINYTTPEITIGPTNKRVDAIGNPLTTPFIQENNTENNSIITSQIVLLRPADLRITQTATSGTLYQGDTVTYIINYGNSGEQTATGVLLSSTITSGILITSSSLPISRSGNNNFERDMPTISPGQTGRIIMTGIVQGSFSGGNTISNTAMIRQDGGLLFNGNTHYINAPSANTSEITVHVIFKPFRNGFFEQIVNNLGNGRASNINGIRTIDLRTNNTLRVSVQNVGIGGDIITIPYTTNETMDITLTIGSGRIKGYKNGLIQGDIATSRTINNSYYTKIGNSITGVYQFNGILYDLKIFNKELSSGEVQQLYMSQGSSIPSSASGNIIADWRFNDMSGQILSDHGPNNLSGSLINYTTPETTLGLTNKRVDSLGNPLTTPYSEDPQQDNNYSVISNTIGIRPDLRITKSANITGAKLNDIITYTIRYGNSGGDITGITLSDTLISGLQFISSTPLPSGSSLDGSGNRNLTRSGLALTGGWSGSLILTAQVISSFGVNGIIRNTGVMSSSPIERSTENNISGVGASYIVSADILGSLGPPVISNTIPGQFISHTISRINNGPDPSGPMTIQLSRGTGYSYISSSISGIVYITGSSRSMPSLNVGQTGSIVITGIIQSGINIIQTNSITMSGIIIPASGDQNLSNNILSGTILLKPPTLSIVSRYQNRGQGSQIGSGKIGIYSGQQLITGLNIQQNESGLAILSGSLFMSLSGIFTIIIEGNNSLMAGRTGVIISPGYTTIDLTTGYVIGGAYTGTIQGNLTKNGDIVKGSSISEGRNYINSLDLAALFNHIGNYSLAYNPQYDLNNDGFINAADTTILLGNFYEAGYGRPYDYNF